MQKSALRRMERYTKRNALRRVWNKFVRVMACIVVFCTTYALILPAITMEQVHTCGLEAHTHDESCYMQHTETKPPCLLEESEEHTHGPECAGETVINEELICILTEHIHDASCVSDPEADVETAADWEPITDKVKLTGNYREDLLAVAKTQLGYSESQRNYLTEDGILKKGYTRYGDWYGIPYGDWDAMFVSFCLHYAGVPEEELPRGSNSREWMELLERNRLMTAVGETLPQPGQPVFYTKYNGARCFAGILSGVDTENDPATGETVVSALRIIAGDVENKVAEISVKPEELAGFCDLELISGEQAAELPEVPINDIIAVPFAAEGDPVFRFTTANPAALQEGVDYVVYFGTNDNLTFLTTIGYIDSTPVPGTGYWTSPYTMGYEWELTPAQIGTQELSRIAWRVVKTGNQYYLVSQKDGQRLFIAGNLWLGADGTKLTNTSINGAATKIASDFYGTYYLQNSGGNWVGVSDSGSATTMYFAQVSEGISAGPDEPLPTDPPETEPPATEPQPTDPSETGPPTTEPPATEPLVTEPPPTEPFVPSYPYHPHAVHTGNVNISRLRFYNICENGDSGVSALAGCEFRITGDNGYSATVISGDSAEVHLPAGIPDGTYTITEVSVPSGYMRDTHFQRTFTVKDGALASDKNIGTFINHDLEQITSEKSAEVEDYNNRIYQVLLTAESHMRMYQMDPVDVLFVVDQSNSMLFPSGLKSTGKSVTLRLDGANNVSNLEALNLDKSRVHYIISDPTGTSTVWAVWHNGHSWMYQDASYYAKAKHNNAAGYQDPNERAIFPENRSYNDQKNAEASGTRSNGGGIGFNLSGSGLGKDIDAAWNDTKTFQVYTATDEFNRLHYLEEALANMIYELADINAENRVTLTEFTKTVDEANDCMGPLKLTPENADALVAEVRSINTSGGTRQDIALKHIHEKHLNDPSKGYSGDPQYTYTILVTDGAPVLSSGSDIDNLGSPNDAPTTTGNTVYGQIKGYAELVRQKSTLMTVGLGMDNVESGKEVLRQIASNTEHFCALDDASELVKAIQELLFEGFRPKEMIHITGTITDEISDSFYPIAWVGPGAGEATGRQVLVQDADQDWILLQPGDWITLDGRFTQPGSADAAGQLDRREDGTFFICWENIQLTDPNADLDLVRVAWVNSSSVPQNRQVVATEGSRTWILLNEGDYIDSNGQYVSDPGWITSRYGRVVKDNNGRYSIEWGWNTTPANRQMYSSAFEGWGGTFYVKAKEDFIGGNAIDTNKTATITSDHIRKAFPVPTVNVRLLDMNEHSSEVTVYLGDIVNETGHGPVATLRGFFEDTVITKLIADGGNVLNKLPVLTTDGLEEAVFYLRYAMGRDLTEDEWALLAQGQTITVPYTYDHASSHGAVGEFTFRLEKTGIDGASPAYEEHEATVACQSDGTPLTENCDNPAETYKLHITYTAYGLGENGRPNTNVHNGSGSPGSEVGTGTTLETGLGTVAKENVHEVHVISGAIRIRKRFADGITDTEDRSFTFILHREEDGEDTSRDVTKTITIPAGQTQGSTAITFSNLRRGTYHVREGPNDWYMVESITVLDTTNCRSEPAIGGSAKEVTFVMGINTGGLNVIGRHAGSDPYTSYIDPVNGVFGEAEFTNTEIIYEGDVPAVKVWGDGESEHLTDRVYLVLCLDGAPVLDSDGNARLLRLDRDNGWQGSFTVPLADKDDKVSNYNYSVREVSQISDSEKLQWQRSILENDGSTIYYEKVLQSGDLIGVDGRGYMVRYETAEDGTWIVTNLRAVELPETGGMGTTLYSFSGLLMIAAALILGYSQRRKKERRHSG